MGTFPVGTQVSSPVGAGEPLTAAALTQPSLRRWVRPWREGQELCSKSPAGPHQPHTMFLIRVIIPITLAEPTTLHLFPKAAVADRFSSRARNQTLIPLHHAGEGKKNCSPSAKLMQMPTLI